MVEKIKKRAPNGTVGQQNGEVHWNGTNGVVGDEQPTIHPKVVGPATASVVRVLASSSSSSCNSKNDCRSLLRRLIRTGYVSARTHFVFPDILYHCMNLQSKRTNVDEEISCYTPLEAIHDILDHCSDVSERIMVISMSFCMSRVSDEDIISYMRKSNRNWDGSEEVAAFDGSENETDRQASSRRMRLLAVGDLLSKMIRYSPCNDGILRHAMASELSAKELILLIRIFRDFRVPTGTCKTVVVPMTVNLTIWLSCSLDVARATTEHSEKLLQQTSKWIHHELRTMDGMFVMSAMVQQRLLSEDRSALDSSTAGLTNKQIERHKVAGYQIERIQF
jgi:hypothetical protein